MPRMVTKARFELARYNQVSFREITLDGRKIFVAAGRQQRLGETELGAPELHEKHGTRYADENTASDTFDRLCAQQEQAWKDGKRTNLQVEAVDEQPLAPGASNPQLEAPLWTAEDPAAAARVYADWLQSQGDPVGELAALHQAGKADAAAAWLEARAGRLLGELDVQLGSGVKGLVWRQGFLAGATLTTRYDGDEDLGQRTAEFLALPLTRFLTTLKFGLADHESGGNDWGPSLAAVVASPRAAQIRELHFTEYTSEDCEISWTPYGDLSAVWQLPALEHLHIRSGEGGTVGAIKTPTLKTYIRESGGLAREEIDAIVNADWPQLQRLDIWFGSDDYGAQGTVGSIARILDGQSAPGITHFGAVNCEFTPDLIGPLAVSKLLPRLHTLDLSKGILMDDDALALIKHRQAFAHLKRLDLSRNMFNEAGPELLQALPMADLSGQRYEHSEGGEYRYAAVGE